MLKRFIAAIAIALGVALVPALPAQAYTNTKCFDSNRGSHSLCVTVYSHWESGWALTTAEVDQVRIDMYGSVGLESPPKAGWGVDDLGIYATTGVAYWTQPYFSRSRNTYHVYLYPNTLVNKSAKVKLWGHFYRDEGLDGSAIGQMGLGA